MSLSVRRRLPAADPDADPDALAEPAGRSVMRALTGAAVSVSGVLLGIGSLLLVTDDPSQGQGPAVRNDQPVLERPVLEQPAPEQPAPEQPAPSPPSPLAPSAAPSPSAPGVAAPAPTPPAASTPPEAAASPVVAVTVLNNSTRTGLADRAAARFERGGWPVALVGNFRGQIPVTTVYYDPGLEVSARAFAAAFDGIVRVRPRFATLPARGVVVVLTREFAA